MPGKHYSGKHRAQNDIKRHRVPARPAKSYPERGMWVVPSLSLVAMAVIALLDPTTEAKPKPEMPIANTCSVVSVHDVIPHEQRGDGAILDRIDARIGMNQETARKVGNRAMDAVNITVKDIGEKPHKVLSSMHMEGGMPVASFYLSPDQRDGTRATISVQPGPGEKITCDTEIVREEGQWHIVESPGAMPLRSAEQPPTVPPRHR